MKVEAAARGFALFETTIGLCGVAWDAGLVVGLTLPAPTRALAGDRLARLRPGLVEAPEPWPDPIGLAIRDIRALFAGGRPDLKDVALDLDPLPEFDRQVYAITRDIPAGETLTYGDVARQLGDLGLSRAVGQSLGRNPFPIVIPCHRVVAAAGEIGGFSAPGGAATKRRILAIESAQGELPW
jgi:methylated-DNA-[protein]-cysteine S-methyltransferase